MSPFWAEGLEIETLADGDVPRAFTWQGRTHRILDPATRWRVHTAWWRETEIWRDYWEAPTDTGLLCTFYRDLRAGGWRLERVRE